MVISIAICQAIIYYIGIKEVIGGGFSIGRIVALIQFFQMISSPVYDLINLKLQKSIIKPMRERINSIIELPQDHICENNDIEFEGLSLRDLELSYEDKYVIRNLNVELPNKGIIIVNGESGTGKSTLLKTVVGLKKQKQGEVVYIIRNGANSLRHVTPSIIRSSISFVPQEPEILSDTVENNIKLYKSQITSECVEKSLKDVHLDNRIDIIEGGLNKEITNRSGLSGGEKARISIARAIANDKKIIVLDEPFASLDRENVMDLCEVINRIAIEKLIIVATHKYDSLLNIKVAINIQNDGTCKIINAENK